MSADPRRVGGVYRCAYWQQTYEVLATERRDGVAWFRVRWADGGVTVHCTAWDRRDRVVSQPS